MTSSMTFSILLQPAMAMSPSRQYSSPVEDRECPQGVKKVVSYLHLGVRGIYQYPCFGLIVVTYFEPGLML